MPNKGGYVRFKDYERKLKSAFMIYANFENDLVPEDNGKQDPDQSYESKHKKHLACSYGYKFICANDKFTKPFKSY